jgi:ATPase subunit of ABC transporter with duplicated ATPase domains
MIETENLSISFGGATLFENVSIKFNSENCYGLIGANGAGKSTFLKILAGDIEPSKGQVIIPKGKRVAMLRQNQFAFDNEKALNTVLMGHPELYKIYKERDELYSKSEMTEEEGIRIGELESEFAEIDGYTAEAEAATMLNDLDISNDHHEKLMKDLEPGIKVRVLLAQALFGNPDILLLDEPTNQLDYISVLWLEKFLFDFKNTVIVVSHDRHFLNKVCTHIADVDYKNIKIFVGNYDFWQQSSNLIQSQLQDQHKKQTDKIKELEDFVRRFSANASKSKQATSRKKLIDKIRPDELATTSRRSPYIAFKAQRPCGNNILKVSKVSHSVNGVQLLKNVSFTLNRHDKIAITGRNDLSRTILLDLLAGKETPDEGTIEWGNNSIPTYFPKDNSEFFKEDITLFEWLDNFTKQDDDQLIRGFLGRMLFSGEAVEKDVKVLSGGEKARAMFSKQMLAEGNVLLFDEPTDHLDLEAITTLNEGLIKFDECILFTSHDFELLNTVANRVIEVTPNGMIDRMSNFNDYMQNPEVANLRKKLYEK